MKAFNKALLSAAMLATLGLGNSANANIVDLFTDPTDATNDMVEDRRTILPIAQANACGSGTIDGTGCFMEYAGSNILGGYRDLYVDLKERYNGATSGGTSMSAGGGLLSFSNDSNNRGIGVIQWDGGDNASTLDKTGLKDVSGVGQGANLINQQGCGPSGCIQFVATVVQADNGFEYSITLWDMDGTGKALTTGTQFAVNSPYLSNYLFSWWNLADGDHVEDGLPFNITTLAAGSTAGLDFQHIGAMELDLNLGTTVSAANLDLSLSSIEKNAPEPGALALAGLALAGLGAATRRRNMLSKA